MITNKIAHNNIMNALNTEEKYVDIYIFYGNMEKQIILSSIQIIENKLRGLNYSKKMITRSKLICIELLENVQKHQSDNPELTSYFEVKMNENKIIFITGNSIANKEYLLLLDKLNSYYNMDLASINMQYLQQLKNGILDKTGNAGLGILTIIKRSNKNYNYDFEKISNRQYYFNNSVMLERDEVKKQYDLGND